MLRKNSNHCYLVSVCLIFALTVLSSCNDEKPVSFDPTQGEESAPSAKDNLPWPLTPNMDTVNYRPGDDFFMYCNGTYWNETELDDYYYVRGIFETEIGESLQQIRTECKDLGFEQLENMLDSQLSNDEFYAFLKPFYDRIDSIQSYEDAFSLAAHLKKEGVESMMYFYINMRDVIKASLVAPSPKNYKHYYEPFLINDHPDYVFANTTPDPAQDDDDDEDYDDDEDDDFYDDDEEDDYDEDDYDEDDEIEEIADEMFADLIWPVFGLDEDLLINSFGYEKWLSTPLDELKAFMKMVVFRDFAAMANTQGFDYMTKTSDTEATDATGWIGDRLSELKEYLDNRSRIEKYITPQLKAEVMDMCNEMRQVFIDRIGSLGWMSSSTKVRAQKKIERIRFYVGGPERWMADSPDLSDCDNVLQATQIFYKTELDYKSAFVGMKAQDDMFNYYIFVYGWSLLKINCNYDPNYNTIVIYPPFMMPPYYDADMHPAMKYGMLMSVIGHEITHSVDASCIGKNEDGEFEEWWTIQDKMEYKELQQQLVELYNRIPVLPDFSPFICCNGELTLDENIADLGGVEIAHQAFVNYCTRKGFYGPDLDEMERKFFQAYANKCRTKYGYEYYNLWKNDTHSFDRERVNGVLMNIDRWYELYNVQWGDYLYLHPQKRIHIW